MAPPVRTRPSFPLSLPSGSFHKLLIILHQRADRLKTTITQLTNLIRRTTALYNSMKLWAMPCRATQHRRVMVESLDKMQSTGEPVSKFSHLVVSDSLQPHDYSTPGLLVYHQLPPFTQTHVHRVGDAIQPSHSLSSPSPLAPSPCQHQGLFQWVNSSLEMAKVLEFQL